ncbi:Dihydrolipoyl dehydrogenase [Arthrobacter agilis]|uniref:dihydrolipoyl dehydrogenase family protein n=1 Tax=Arthrobacter agilis TaxID=37921 RepID=UPI000F719093|nr:NAD(P)/FAD-dependent oxidoreductase [Arthrobacter agilis]VDR32317.1 Dihydrolipoyl dehydrogenase [Arthrobacter agilis]
MKSSQNIIDLLVVGGGTAGIVGARTAARLGARTVLVERSRTGGDCLWTGCVPSKTLLSAAAGRRVHDETDEDYFRTVRTRITAAITTIEPDDAPETLEAAGVEVRSGRLRFTASGTAELDGVTVRFRQALVATGSEPFLPEIPGLGDARYVTSETIWDLAELPSRLVIIGGGPIACEIGQAFGRLGSRVTMLVRSEILPKEDREAAAIVRESLRHDGVTILEQTGTSRVEVDTAAVGRVRGGCAVVHASDGSLHPADVILVAAGRNPRTEGLGLEKVGVDLDGHGSVIVDAAMRTSAPTVWAAGDVTQHPHFTHVAGFHASTAASNAVLGVRRAVPGTIPRVTYTSPEVAAVGPTTAVGRGTRISTVRHAESDRAITEGQEPGFSRLVIGRGGRILGGTIVGPRAGESLGELTLAVRQKLTTRDLAGVIHAYPTYNDSLWNAAIQDAGATLDKAWVKAVMSGLVRFTRRRVDRASR